MRNIIATTHCGEGRSKIFNASLRTLLLFSTVDIHVFTDRPSPPKLDRVSYHFINDSNIPFITRNSPCSGVRYEMFRTFSGTNQYVLYLDGDVIATESVMPVFNQDLAGEAWSAAVLECTERCKSWYQHKGVRQIFMGVGINAGVWLFNSGTKTSFFEFVSNHTNTSLPIWDQTVLNRYFYNHPTELKLLDCKWNMRHNSNCAQPSGIFHGTNMIFDDSKKGWWGGARSLKHRLGTALKNMSSMHNLLGALK